eukprot:gene9118-10694_t
MRLSRIDKPVGTLLLLYPCWWSTALAAQPGHLPDLKLMLMFGAGAFLMRSAGCVINDMADHKFDRKVERTKTRPIAASLITHKQAMALLFGQLSISFGILLTFNPYTYFILGLAFNWGALVGYSAVTGSCDWSIVAPLYMAGVSWTMVYDTIYAHMDKKDDVLVGVKSTALAFANNSRQILSAFSVATMAGIGMAGVAASMPPVYYLGSSICALHLTWQMRSVDFNDPKSCMKFFVANRTPHNIVKGGSNGKGTNLVDRMEVDLVVVYHDYDPDEASCKRKIQELQECLTKHLGIHTAEEIYAERKDNDGKLIIRLKSVKMVYKGISFDILPAPVITKPKQFYTLDQRKELPFSFAAASPMQVKFIRKLDAQYKDLVRLCKCWRDSLSTFKWKLSTRPSSYLIELLALHVYNEHMLQGFSPKFSLERAFMAFLTLLTKPNYEISWNHMLPSGSHYDKNHPMSAMPFNGRLVVDPANPANNVANCLADWTDITKAANTTLSMLKK